MRWKLVITTSLTAAIVACGLWSAFAIAVFGSARAMATSDLSLLCSLLIPAGLATLAAIFVYRHTSRRRKTQAILTTILTVVLTGGIYLVASQFFPDKLMIPRTYEVRHAR